MVKVYATLIVKGQKVISDVPSSIRNEVKQVLIEWGYPELAENA